MKKSYASLRLFNAVLSDTFLSEPLVKTGYGVVVAPNATGSILHILDYLREETLNGNQLNASFYKSWQKVQTVSLSKRIAQQVMHYFSTYGLEALGVYNEKFVYIPGQALEVPENLSLILIRGLSRDKLIELSLGMLSSGAALKQETIDDVLEVLDELDYQFTGNENIANREALVIVAQKTGVLPNKGADLFRYLVYNCTGESLLIKNNVLIKKIKESQFLLPKFTATQHKALAESFNRYKPLWLAFKAANVQNTPAVNHISRLSKVNHKPLPKDVLGSLTSDIFTEDQVVKAAEKATVFRLVRALNSVRYYRDDNTARVYNIRNGRKFAQQEYSKREKFLLGGYEKTLKEVLRTKVSQQKVFIPEGVSYDLPTSEKKFVGNIPEGSTIFVPYSEGSILVGIHWEDSPGSRVDLDLSALSINGKVGWNASWDNRELSYSGDITSAPKPHGASEWLFTKKLGGSYAITVNLFHGPQNHPFQVILGYAKANEVGRNHIINPNRVVFQGQLAAQSGRMTIGTLSPAEGGVLFKLAAGATGSGRVSSFSEKDQILLDSTAAQERTRLTFRDVFNVVDSPEEADVDLTPSTLSRTTLLDLLSV